MDTCKKIKRGEIPDWQIKLCYDDTIRHLGYEPWAWRYEYL
ncbi:hypothetical protein AAA088_03525 [Hominifimenecus microfluidus]|nr:hypothetical protein [Hominifimenecus microfluidus]